MRFTKFNEVVNGVNCVVDPTTWAPEEYDNMVEGLVHQGIRIILQRATASAKDPIAAMKAKVAQLQAGTYSFGAGGGGGPRMDAETRGLIAYFDATKAPKEKAHTQKSMEQKLVTITRQQVILSMREAGSDDADIKAKAKEIQEASEDPDNIEAVRTALIEGDAAPFVAIEKAAEAAKAKAEKAGTGLKVSLTLKPKG